MKQVIFNHPGLPEEVLQYEDAPLPQPKPHEVRIKVTARNINPSDIMFIGYVWNYTKITQQCGI